MVTTGLTFQEIVKLVFQSGCTNLHWKKLFYFIKINILWEATVCWRRKLNLKLSQINFNNEIQSHMLNKIKGVLLHYIEYLMHFVLNIFVSQENPTTCLLVKNVLLCLKDHPLEPRAWNPEDRKEQERRETSTEFASQLNIKPQKYME